MTRLEYLKALESALKLHLSRDEINEIMRDYGEYFNEGEHLGKSEWQIIVGLGNPKEVAREIINESLAGKPRQQAGYYTSQAAANVAASAAKSAATAAKNAATVAKEAAGSFGSILPNDIWRKLLVVALFILCAPFILAALAGTGTLIFGLFCSILAALVVCGIGVLAGIALLVAACLFVTLLPAAAIGLVIVLAIGMIAGGSLGGCLMLLFGRWCWHKAKLLWSWLFKKGWSLGGGAKAAEAQPENKSDATKYAAPQAENETAPSHSVDAPAQSETPQAFRENPQIESETVLAQEDSLLVEKEAPVFKIDKSKIKNEEE